DRPLTDPDAGSRRWRGPAFAGRTGPDAPTVRSPPVTGSPVTGQAITRAALARMVDHTLLKPEATAADVAALCAEAAELDTFSICVSPNRLPLPPGALPPTVAVAT